MQTNFKTKEDDITTELGRNAVWRYIKIGSSGGLLWIRSYLGFHKR